MATLGAGRQLVNIREELSGKGDGYPYAMHAEKKIWALLNEERG